MYHYLENPAGSNPFDDDYSRKHPNMAPYLRPLSQREAARENVDTEDEIIWGNMMSNQRNIFLHKLVSSMESDKKAKPAAPHFVPGNMSPFSAPCFELTSVSAAAPEATPSVGHRTGQEPSRDEAPFMFYVPGREPTPSREVNEQGEAYHVRLHTRRLYASHRNPNVTPRPPSWPSTSNRTTPAKPASGCPTTVYTTPSATPAATTATTSHDPHHAPVPYSYL